MIFPTIIVYNDIKIIFGIDTGSRKIFSFNMYGQQRQNREDRKGIE